MRFEEFKAYVPQSLSNDIEVTIEVLGVDSNGDTHSIDEYSTVASSYEVAEEVCKVFNEKYNTSIDGIYDAYFEVKESMIARKRGTLDV